jgi:phosphoserine phosphatase
VAERADRHRVPVTRRAAAPEGLVAVDLDGTLLRGTSVSRLLAEHLGHRDLLEELEAAFAAGAITNAVVADRSAAFLRDVFLDDVGRLLASASWLQGIAEGVELLRRRRMRVLLTTITWRFAAEIAARLFRFDAACGTEMEVVDGRLSGKVAAHFDAGDKAEFARRACVDCGIDSSRLVAVGDSLSDLPLFALADLAVALNATEPARRAATVAVETDDFRDVAQLIAERYDAGSRTRGASRTPRRDEPPAGTR